MRCVARSDRETTGDISYILHWHVWRFGAIISHYMCIYMGGAVMLCFAACFASLCACVFGRTGSSREPEMKRHLHLSFTSFLCRGVA
jgi:hypothetical protein